MLETYWKAKSGFLTTEKIFRDPSRESFGHLGGTSFVKLLDPHFKAAKNGWEVCCLKRRLEINKYNFAANCLWIDFVSVRSLTFKYKQ